MPSFSVGLATQDGVNIVVYTGNYSWFRVFVRPSNSNTAIFDRYFNETQDFSTYVSGLSAGTSYTVNVAYGNSSGSATNWIGAQTFSTLDPIEVVSMGIACGTGISSISIQYHDENGNVSSRTCTGTEYIFVEKNTTQYVTNIECSAGYSHPVNCSGQTTWQMTNKDGTFLDAALSMTTAAKTFTFTATEAENSSGVVWIGGNYYQSYVYFNGSWRSVVPYIYYNGGWHAVSK